MRSLLFKLVGTEALAAELAKKQASDFQKVQQKNILSMRNRAVATQNPAKGGTPVESNELRLGASVSSSADEFGYVAHYAPHVEFGHRTRDGGFVPGQYFLRTNVEIQRPLFREDLIKELRK